MNFDIRERFFARGVNKSNQFFLLFFLFSSFSKETLLSPQRGSSPLDLERERERESTKSGVENVSNKNCKKQNEIHESMFYSFGN